MLVVANVSNPLEPVNDIDTLIDSNERTYKRTLYVFPCSIFYKIIENKVSRKDQVSEIFLLGIVNAVQFNPQAGSKDTVCSLMYNIVSD